MGKRYALGIVASLVAVLLLLALLTGCQGGDGPFGASPSEVEVVGRGTFQTMMASRVVTADGTVSTTAVTGLDRYNQGAFLLTLSGKAMDASTTLDVYVQRSVDRGTTWDDLAHYIQITTTGTMTNGTYVLDVNGDAASVADRATTDGSLAANNVRSVLWGDRLRVKLTAANFTGPTDTITLKLEAYLRP